MKICKRSSRRLWIRSAAPPGGAKARRILLFGRVAVGAIRTYQRFLSPMLPPSCRFTPSCSQYMIEAIRRYGLIRGLLMGSWRILRCNPFSRGGFDPVK